MKSRLTGIVCRGFRSVRPALEPRECIGRFPCYPTESHQFVANPEGDAIFRVKTGHDRDIRRGLPDHHLCGCLIQRLRQGKSGGVPQVFTGNGGDVNGAFIDEKGVGVEYGGDTGIV